MALRDPGRPTPSAPAGGSSSSGGRAIVARYPDLGTSTAASAPLVALPLRVTGRTIGAINLSFPGQSPRPDRARLPRRHGRHLRPGLRAHRGVRGGRAADRAPGVPRRGVHRARRSSLDLDVTINRVARLAVPTFADWCAIDVVRDGRMHRLAVAHVDPEKVELAVRAAGALAPGPVDSRGGAGAVAPHREARAHPRDHRRDARRRRRDEEHLQIARELQLRSALLVPLFVRGRVIGVISWVSTDEHRLYDEDDVRFAEHLARRAATAIDNSELYSQTRAAAEQLQRAVLPRTLVGDDGCEVACRLPPVRPRRGRRRLLRRLPARRRAATSPSSGTSWAGASPRPRRWPRCVRRCAPSRRSTRPGGGRGQARPHAHALRQRPARHARVRARRPRAGTLVRRQRRPPTTVVLRADGVVEQLAFADGPPLGVVAGRPRRARPCPSGGDTMLAFTDGLVERRDEDIDEGLARLRGTHRKPVADRAGRRAAHGSSRRCATSATTTTSRSWRSGGPASHRAGCPPPHHRPTLVRAAPAQVALELLGDGVAARLRQVGGVLGLLEALDVLGDLGVRGRQLVDAALPGAGVLVELAVLDRPSRRSSIRLTRASVALGDGLWPA